LKSAKTPSNGDGSTHWKWRQTTENKDPIAIPPACRLQPIMTPT